MAFCSNCGTQLAADSAFCTTCGKPADGRRSNPNEEKEFLEVTGRLLRWEQKAWKIGALVFAIIGVAFFAIFSMIAVFGGLFGQLYMEEFLLFFFVYGLVVGAMFVGVGIANYVPMKRMTSFAEGTADFASTRERCESVGMIVYCVFFNSVALVFYLINFIRMKANRHVVDALLQKG